MKTQSIPAQRLRPMPLSPEARLRVALVYQAGIANVFVVDSFNLADFGRNARRVWQADFRTSEAFARGMAEAGAIVHSLACNMAGDIARAQWSDDLDAAPFSDKFCPVKFARGL